ncbi:MAG: EscJ/YscJ/HrcJ family type III secretion inner membrane ring protein [Chlamydiales bacterium]
MQRRFILLSFFAIALFLTSCDTSSTIVNNVAEREANEIVVLLQSRGIDAEKIPAPVTAVGGGTGVQTWNISVPASQITDSLAILNQAGLPRTKGQTLLDLFGSPGLVPSDLQDRIRYQEGLSEQIGNTIRKMDGIIDATVQITFIQEAEEEKETMTASVYIKHRGIPDNPNSLTVTKIKRLVASAVPGLTPENVAVISDRALYADISLDTSKLLEDEMGYISIWGVNLARDSTSLFRVIFYAFIIFLFIFICAFIWLFWKCWPIIQETGGVKSLFHLSQYALKTPHVKEEAPVEEGGGGEE